MKKLILNILPLLAIVLAAACSDDDEGQAAYVPPTAEGTYTDVRDGENYRWVRYGTLDWMAENFRYDLGDETNCLLYVDADDNTHLSTLGRLYTPAGAQSATPDGWRLPTDEDWKKLEMALGMSSNDADKTGWRGNIAKSMLTANGDTTALNIVLAGYYTPNTTMGMSGYRFISAYGWYWSSTTDDDKGSGYYYGRKFIYNSTAVDRESFENKLMFSVRYVRDAQ